MGQVSRTDPRVTAAARALEITMIQRAWEDDGTLFIQDPYDTYEVVSEGYTDTLPKNANEKIILDDFTTIPGVGSVTAQKLHDLELYTYEDLRVWVENGAPDAEDQEISDRTIGQIEAWLQDFLA